MQLTKDQKLVVTTRNKDILVSAAAGSGKTAVLVQRILSKITDEKHPVDIDKMLIVTFTNAAAAEMRERIYKEICDRLESQKDDENLQRQSTLIHNAMITTIDSFCLFLLRNHFQEIGLDPGFRVADPGEIKLFEKDALELVLEEFYETAKEEFYVFCDAFAPNGKDDKIEEMIMQLYHCCMAHPWPEKWLDDCYAQLQGTEDDLVWQTQWMQFLWEVACAQLEGALSMANMAHALCEKPDGPYMYATLIEEEKKAIQTGLNILSSPLSKEQYEAFVTFLSTLSFGRLSSKKDESVSAEVREHAKLLRGNYKDMLLDLQTTYFSQPLDWCVEKEKLAANLNSTLICLTKRYIEILSEIKKEKNIVDFSDAEHMALQVLYKDGKPTQTAISYRDYFDEVMIDEYQDSNMVQEILLGSIAKEVDGQHNRFMVGDMKQSIYKFRLARPEIFMEKYDRYKDADDNTILIGLKQNFRSREEVLDSTNDVFVSLMHKSVGGVCYDQDAMLYKGAKYPKPTSEMFCSKEESHENPYQTEILCLQKSGMKQASYRRYEALMIAQRIKEIVGKLPISAQKESSEMRMASYKDIVILTRSEKGVTNVLRRELLAAGIPVHVTSKEGYFSATEISVLMDFLRVIDNPYNDIALCSCLKAMFFSYDDEMLSTLRIRSKETSLYDCLKQCSLGEDAFSVKSKEVLDTIEAYRQFAIYDNVTQLVSRLLRQFHYVEYVAAMPAGSQRKANVEMFVEKTVDFEKTSMHGLFAFISYMEQLQKYQVEFGEASTLSETADVVRIMTIHKSKGLEFPVCILACADKSFNMADTKQAVLMDADWGLASDYVEVHRRVRGKTLKKKILATKMKRDAIGEELRVLYVAMTRAKEKLIVTGCIDKPEEKLAEYQQLLVGDEDIPACYVADSSSMLQLLMMAYTKRSAHMKMRFVPKEEIETQNQNQLVQEEDRRALLQTLYEGDVTLSREEREEKDTLLEKFSFVYPHQNLKGLRAKTSVSELKKAAMDEADLHPKFETDDVDTPILPGFMKGEEKLGGADRGSAMHRFMELLDFEKYASIEEEKLFDSLQSDLTEFAEQGRLHSEYVELISLGKVKAFLVSPIAKRMMKAAKMKKLYKEQPFVLSLPAKRVNSEFSDEEIVLIQGIIDVYFEEDGQYVILDYKTDRIESMEALKERYETQLDYYEEAVARILEKSVKEKVLYSFYWLQELSY